LLGDKKKKKQQQQKTELTVEFEKKSIKRELRRSLSKQGVTLWLFKKCNRNLIKVECDLRSFFDRFEKSIEQWS